MSGKVLRVQGPAESEVLLTINEVAERCRVSSRTVGRWIGNGDLVVVRLGRIIRVRPKDS